MGHMAAVMGAGRGLGAVAVGYEVHELMAQRADGLDALGSAAGAGALRGLGAAFGAGRVAGDFKVFENVLDLHERAALGAGHRLTALADELMLTVGASLRGERETREQDSHQNEQCNYHNLLLHFHILLDDVI